MLVSTAGSQQRRRPYVNAKTEKMLNMDSLGLDPQVHVQGAHWPGVPPPPSVLATNLIKALIKGSLMQSDLRHANVIKSLTAKTG